MGRDPGSGDRGGSRSSALPRCAAGGRGAAPGHRAGGRPTALPLATRPARELAARAPLSRASCEPARARSLAPAGASGYWVYDLDAAGDPVLFFDARRAKRRKLASNEKLFTTAAALGRSAPDERLETASATAAS